jgi:glycosidase
MRGKNFITIALIALMFIPLLPVSARQGEDEPLARLRAALENFDSYTSYVASGESTVATHWEGSMGGQVVDGLTAASTAQITETVVGSTLQQQYTIENSSEQLNQASVTYGLNAEIRVVDGVVYAQGSHSRTDPSLPALPDGWVTVTNPDEWPGLDTTRLDDFVDDQPDDLFNRIYGASLADLIDRLSTDATITSEQSTLEDGTPVETITAVLSLEGWRVLTQIDTSVDDVDSRVINAMTSDPMTITFALNEAGELVQLGYIFDLNVQGIDIAGLNGAPEGFTLDVHNTEALTLRLTSFNDSTLAAITAPEMPTTEPEAASVDMTDLPWWNDRVFYEIFVRSFYDSDGDGVGDLRGVIEKLDYLQEMGITGLWLMPIMQSPSYHGYDVTDYYTIEEDYGTNQDFLDLMAAAHERGMVVIVDLVLNHTSTEHPWFTASADSDPDYRDWYIWNDDPPAYRGPWGQEVWYPMNGSSYFALFWSGMPDLNYENPEVTDQMYDVIRFWLQDMGADGFRLDAIRHLHEDGPVMANAPATLEWLQAFHEYVRSLNPEALTVGEVWDVSAEVVPYVGDRVDLAFEFDLASAIINAVQTGRGNTLARAQTTVLRLYPEGQYAAFITNHDQDRVMSQLAGNEGAMHVAATLLLTNPGVPFIYYGEEIGMEGEKPDERIRTPMQWDDTPRTAGFTTANSAWENLNNDIATVNVAAQDADPESLLNHYRTLIRIRNEHPALQEGPMQMVETSVPQVYSFIRYSEDEAILVLVNLSQDPISDYTLTLSSGILSGELNVEVLLGDGTPAAPVINVQGGFDSYTPFESLPPQSSFIVRLSH